MNEQDHIIETFSEMATRYEDLMNSELRRFWGIDYYAFIKEVLGDLDISDGTKILDVATGTAFIPRNILKENPNADHLTGLDITLDMLLNGKKLIEQQPSTGQVDFVCASAHDMPFKQSGFDLAICCLATHHMNVSLLLSELSRSIKPGGKLHIGDVGGSAKWKIGLIKSVIKVLAFVYFLFTENFSRAKAESAAVANVLTSEEWKILVQKNGFINIKVREVQSSRFWVPNPVIIEAIKSLEVKE